MQIKNIISATAFITFFTISLLMGTVFTSSVFSGIFHKEINPQTQAKIYDILQKDLQNKMDRANYRENNGGGDLAFVKAVKDYGEKSNNMKISDLPEDFQMAYKDYATASREFADFFINIESMPNEINMNHIESLISDRKSDEQRKYWKNVVSVSKSYGIKFDSNNNLIEKNN